MTGPDLKKTPLNQTHRDLGARMVEFGGWDMPVQFSGIVAEHHAVRNDAGLFDVSHMGEIEIRGPGSLDLLQKLTCNDVSKLQDGRCQYNGLLYPNAGFVDDILIYRRSADDYFVVVNASNADKDWEWVRQEAGNFDVDAANTSDQWAQIAIQGPKAERILARKTETSLVDLGYYRFTSGAVAGADAIISRTGYTGEDGFEVYVKPEEAPAVFRELLDAGREDGILPAGLGARDTLRLEAKMALYGNDIDETTTPLNADLGWMVKLGKGDFHGRDVLERQTANGIDRILVGFEMIDRGIARHGHPIVENGREIGIVTSGSHSPTLEKSIGLAYVPIALRQPGTEITISIRGKDAKARVVSTPFYKRKKD